VSVGGDNGKYCSKQLIPRVKSDLVARGTFAPIPDFEYIGISILIENKHIVALEYPANISPNRIHKSKQHNHLYTDKQVGCFTALI
jgi:hypothetical protein